jgi:hypothetical protein
MKLATYCPVMAVILHKHNWLKTTAETVSQGGIQLWKTNRTLTTVKRNDYEKFCKIFKLRSRIKILKARDYIPGDTWQGIRRETRQCCAIPPANAMTLIAIREDRLFLIVQCQERNGWYVSREHRVLPTTKLWSSGYHFCFIFERSRLKFSARKPAIVTEFCGFPQSLQASAGIVS